MAKRKKYPKLPNGFGSIKHLGGNRTNPYSVHPPTTEFGLNGAPKTPKAIAYVDDWYWGFSILMAYKAGTYVKGVYPPKPTQSDIKGLNNLVQSVISDLSIIRQAAIGKEEEAGPTFAEVYKDFYNWKFDDRKEKKYSSSTKYASQTAFKNCSVLHDKRFKDIDLDDLQNVIDNCPLKHASLELIVSLYNQMYEYAEPRNLCNKNYALYVKINKNDDDDHGVPFNDEELKILWSNKDNIIVEFILIMSYSGYRINAYPKLEINLNEKYFKGGIKTPASKNRIVPIHSAIAPLVEKRLKRDQNLLMATAKEFRFAMYETLSSLNIEKHTPHDCRHTFSKLCEQYEVKENDRKRMLGHSFKNDITNKVYGHRDIEELRNEIEKIKVCY